MIERFLPYIAGPFLLIYLLLLIGSSYMSQQSLRLASDNALLINLEKRASTFSYFHSERENDLLNLARDQTFSVFFSNRSLGMSMEYGLRSSLLSMEEKFQAIVSDRTLNNAPLYLRLLFLEHNGNTLIDVGSARGRSNQGLHKKALSINRLTTFMIRDGDENHTLLILPYFYKNKRMGSIFAEVNQDEVVHYLIHNQPKEKIQYSITISNPAHIITQQTPEKPVEKNSNRAGTGSVSNPTTIPVPGTPFILAAWYSQKGGIGIFLTSRWYLFSLVVLTLLALCSIIIRNRTRTQTLLLRQQATEADRQRSTAQKKNRLLKEEVQKRQNSEALLRTVLETIPDLVWLKNPDGVYLSCNPKFERFFGASQKEIIGKTDYDFVDKELADFFRKHDIAAMNAGSPLINEESVTFASDGHKELLETIKSPVWHSTGELIGVLGIARDITARKLAEEEARYLSSHDPLTGLYNRRILENRLVEEIERAERYQHPLSIFMVDLDHFKVVNDTYGHQNGDLALIHLAKILKKTIRKTDYVARYGGEEFVVVLPETPLSQGTEMAERLCEAIRTSSVPLANSKRIHLTASIGVACFPEHNCSGEGLIGSADAAMYSAKLAGRNQVKQSE